MGTSLAAHLPALSPLSLPSPPPLPPPAALLVDVAGEAESQCVGGWREVSHLQLGERRREEEAEEGGGGVIGYV